MSTTKDPHPITEAELMNQCADSGLLTAYREDPDGCIQEWVRLMHLPMPPMAGLGLEICLAFPAVLVALVTERADRHGTGRPVTRCATTTSDPTRARLTDTEFETIAAAIHHSYEAGDYPPDLDARALGFLGPDGGLLSLLDELRAERQRGSVPSHPALVRYLETTGWSSHAPGPGGTLWTKDGVRLGVTHEPDEAFIRSVLHRLAAAEGRSVEATTGAVHRSAPAIGNSHDQQP